MRSLIRRSSAPFSSSDAKSGFFKVRSRLHYLEIDSLFISLFEPEVEYERRRKEKGERRRLRQEEDSESRRLEKVTGASQWNYWKIKIESKIERRWWMKDGRKMVMSLLEVSRSSVMVTHDAGDGDEMKDVRDGKKILRDFTRQRLTTGTGKTVWSRRHRRRCRIRFSSVTMIEI